MRNIYVKMYLDYRERSHKLINMSGLEWLNNLVYIKPEIESNLDVIEARNILKHPCFGVVRN